MIDVLCSFRLFLDLQMHSPLETVIRRVELVDALLLVQRLVLRPDSDVAHQLFHVLGPQEVDFYLVSALLEVVGFK